MEYEAVEPFGDRRGDWQAASICTAFANITLAARGVSKRFRVSDFLLEFDSQEKEVTKDTKGGAGAQSWQQMKFIAQMWAAAFNADEEKKKKRRR